MRVADRHYGKLVNPVKVKKKKAVPAFKEALKGFFEPYPQPILDGQTGLKGTDIAKILGVRYGHLMQKISKNNTFEMLKYAKLKKVAIPTLNENGVLYDEYIFEARAAELIIAKYDNPTGWMYLRFLQSCKEAVGTLAEEYDRLATEYRVQEKSLNQARQKIQALTKTKTRNAGGGKVVKIITNVVEKRDIFGDVIYYKETEKKTISDMSPREKDLYKIQHSSKVVDGLTREMRETMGKYNHDQGTKALADVASALKNVLNRPDLPEIDQSTNLIPFKKGELH